MNEMINELEAPIEIDYASMNSLQENMITLDGRQVPKDYVKIGIEVYDNCFLVTKGSGGHNNWFCKGIGCVSEFKGSKSRARGHILKVGGRGVSACTANWDLEIINEMRKLEKGLPKSNAIKREENEMGNNDTEATTPAKLKKIKLSRSIEADEAIDVALYAFIQKSQLPLHILEDKSFLFFVEMIRKAPQSYAIPNQDKYHKDANSGWLATSNSTNSSSSGSSSSSNTGTNNASSTNDTTESNEAVPDTTTTATTTTASTTSSKGRSLGPNFATLVVHAGSEPDPHTGAVVPPISLATTFAQDQLGMKRGLLDINSFQKGFEYTRTGNPTRGAFERALAVCEYGRHCCAFASGLAATSAIVQTLSSGDHVVCIDDVYGGTQRYFRQIASINANLSFTFMDMNDIVAVNAACTEKTKLFWIESPTNPLLKITDIQALAALAKHKNILLCVDNTFMSPYFQNPLLLGADIVLHSVTKYIGGHSDVLMGALVMNDTNIYNRLKFIQNGIGAVPSPFDCYLALRGLKTLKLRMDSAASNALRIAKCLESHVLVLKVVYPGLESHPQHELCKTQCSGFGAMITFYIRGDLAVASTFLSSLHLFTLAESLGAVESLVESPAIMTHASVPVEKRAELGISDNLIRLSVGIEYCDDLIDDLLTALERAGESLLIQI